jgi:hypothetical protein
MRTLLDLQQGFARAMTGEGDAVLVLPAIVDDTPGAAARLAIYANHYRVTLTDALFATFPVTARLVGCDFFRATARRYVHAAPPRQPVMCEYGESFPDFLAILPETESVPYLADVARLEWAISLASQAPDPGPAAEADALRLHPSCGVLGSPFPVDDIWQAHQSEDGAVAPVDLRAGPVRLLVGRRPDDTVGWIRLPGAEATFAARLIAGAERTHALAEVRTLNPAFDPVPFIAALIECGFVILPDDDCEEEIPS